MRMWAVVVAPVAVGLHKPGDEADEGHGISQAMN